jgi:hypothetical protein
MENQNVETLFNNKYTSVLEILHRVEKYGIDIHQCVQMCAQCEIEEIRLIQDWFKFTNIERTTDSDGRALMPCNVYRLLNVKDSNGTRITGYYNNGTYLISKNNKNTKLLFDYYGIPIDTKGRPLIIRGHEKACEYYCILRALEPDFIEGKISATAYGYVSDKFDEGVAEARSSFKNITRDDLLEYNQIMYNMIRNVSIVPMNLD